MLIMRFSVPRYYCLTRHTFLMLGIGAALIDQYDTDDMDALITGIYYGGSKIPRTLRLNKRLPAVYGPAAKSK